MNQYLIYHIKRIIKVTNNLYTEKDSICKKCHHIKGDMNCLLCYCPLYETDCGGDYIILPNGIKDCSNCIIPHNPVFVKNYLYNLYKE